MRGEYVLVVLAISAIVAAVALSRAAISRSDVSWRIGVVALIASVLTYIVAAAPQINRPPEAEAETFYRVRLEAAEIERKSIEAQLDKANKISSQVDKALKRSADVEAERDAARIALKRSDLKIEGLRSRLQQEQENLRKTEEVLAKVQKQNVEGLKRIGELQEGLRLEGGVAAAEKAQKERAQTVAMSYRRQLDGARARLRVASSRLAALQSTAARNDTQTYSAQQNNGAVARLQAGITSAVYAVEHKPELNFFGDRRGTYFSIKLKPTIDGGEFEFTSVEPPLISDEQAFLDAAVALFQEELLALEKAVKIELYVRGSADTRQVRNQPNPMKLESFRRYKSVRRLGPDQYASSADEWLKEVSFPLRNEELPNLRAAFLASRLNAGAQSVGLSTTFLVLDQVPAVPFREGQEVNLRPELFLFIPR